MILARERSGSVVECLTRDRRAAGSSLTGVTALWSLSKTHLSKLSTGSTQEDPPRITERLLSGRKESNQTNKQTNKQNMILAEEFRMGNVAGDPFCTPRLVIMNMLH